jgi:hypothetical protein
MRIRLTIAVTVSALLGNAAAPVHAYVVGGNPWPDTTITYYVAAKGYSAAVGRAARNWNRAKVGARFARSSSRADADFVVLYGGSRCEGESPMGFGGWRATTTVYLGAGCSQGLITLTATHELGHVLGLDHENSKCARMNWTFTPSGTPIRCGSHSLSYWLGHPLKDDDIRGARAIYDSSSQDVPSQEPDRPHWHPWR